MFFLYRTNQYPFKCWVLLQLEDWGVDVDVLQKSALAQNFSGWMEDWEKEKHKKNDAVVRALFVNKYKDLMYCLPAQSENDIDWTYD